MEIAVKSMGLTNDETNFTRAIATISIDDVFNIEGVTVKRSKDNNLYVQLPQKQYTDKETGERKYKDVCYPTTKELREKINDVILTNYHQKLEERENTQKKTNNDVKTKEKSKGKTKEKVQEETEEECI